MSNYITGTNYNSNTGFFEITSTDGTGSTTTQSVNFSTLCMIFSLTSLNAQDEVFATQFAEAQEQVTTLTMINDCMQMLNTYGNQVEENGGDLTFLDGVVAVSEDGDYLCGSKDTNVSGCKEYHYTTDTGDPAVIYYKEGSDADKWLNIYRPNLVETGVIQDGSGYIEYGLGVDCAMHESEFSALMENLQTAQATVSSQNEQQMLITNDAANKRSTILQMAQSLMQAAADARKTAAQT